MTTPKQQAETATKALLQQAGTAALSVIDVRDGAAFVTLVNVAVDGLLRPLLLTSALSHHTQCLKANPRGSLLVHGPLPEGQDPLTVLRVTLSGLFSPVAHGDVGSLFLARHPYAETYAGFGDFGYWQMQPEQAHIIAGFGRAYRVNFKDVVSA